MPDTLYENSYPLPPPTGVLFSGTDLGAFASGIYNDLMLASGSPFSVSYISGWLMNHVGELNVSCETSFNTASGFAIPALNFQEVAIYQELFTVYYYKRSATNLLGCAQYDWTTLAEADSRIVKVSRNELAKTYRGFVNDAETRLRYMVAQYRQTKGQPLSVIGDDIIWSPFTDRYWFGGEYNNIFPYFGFYIRCDSL
jgi:hypothetical protein